MTHDCDFGDFDRTSMLLDSFFFWCDAFVWILCDCIKIVTGCIAPVIFINNFPQYQKSQRNDNHNLKP